MKTLFTFTLLLFFTVSSMAFVKNEGTYSDKREELFNINNPEIHKVSNATLVLMTKQNAEKLLNQKKLPSLLEKGFAHYPDPLQSFSFKVKPCQSVKYVNQPSIGLCSGFLVNKDILITAGHCVSDICNPDNVWVKGFQYDLTGKLKKISKDSIFTCKKIIDRKLESPTPHYDKVIDPRFQSTTPDSYKYDKVIDYAVIKIGQKKEVIAKNTYLSPRLSNEAEIEDELIMAGYPLGFPLKITTEGHVLEHRLSRVIITDIDAFKGNSGSAVLNASSGVVEGILSRTGPTFEKEENESCYKIKLSLVDEIADNEFSELTPMTMIPNLKKYLP